jgi:hypothetical protein
MLIIILFNSKSSNSKSSNLKFKSIEDFVFTPWNMGTRYYPSYDIRGYPLQSHMAQLHPWNYPFPGLPFLYWSPFFYSANGKYSFDPVYAKILNKSQ